MSRTLSLAQLLPAALLLFGCVTSTSPDPQVGPGGNASTDPQRIATPGGLESIQLLVFGME